MPERVRKIAGELKYYSKGLYIRLRDEQMFFYASGIAFNGILCIIPFLLLLTSLLGVVLSSSELAIKYVNEVLNVAFPPDSYAQEIKSSMQKVIDDIIRHKSSYGIVGIAILTWTATSLFSAVRSVLNTVYRIKTRKLVIITILEEILLVIILGMVFFVANVFIWLSSVIGLNMHRTQLFGTIPLNVLAGANGLIVAYLPGLVMFYLVNRLIPDKGVTSKVAFIAAFITTVLWWIAGRMFAWYLATFHSYSMLYGAYAFLLVFLFWVYYSSIAFITGVIIAQLYRERNTR